MSVPTASDCSDAFPAALLNPALVDILTAPWGTMNPAPSLPRSNSAASGFHQRVAQADLRGNNDLLDATAGRKSLRTFIAHISSPVGCHFHHTFTSTRCRKPIRHLQVPVGELNLAQRAWRPGADRVASTTWLAAFRRRRIVSQPTGNASLVARLNDPGFSQQSVSINVDCVFRRHARLIAAASTMILIETVFAP